MVARPGRLPHIRCRGALAVRLTGPDTVHLVSTAANPIGGDTTLIRVVVEADAQLRVRTTAASIVLPGRDDPESHVRWELDVDGGLDLDPEPTVIAAHSRHFSDARVQVGGS